MTAELEGIRGVLSRATGNGWEAAYRQDVGRLLDLVGELRLAAETGGAPALDRPGTYTPARGAEAEDLRRELEAIVDAKRPRNVARRVRWVLDSVAARDSLLWLIERDDAEAIRKRDAARAEADRLRADLAEAQATLANERGEGEPPCEGWEWCVENTEGIWRRSGEPRADVNHMVRDDADEAAGRLRWHWWIVSGSYEAPAIHSSGWEDTARAAMKAATAAKEAR